MLGPEGSRVLLHWSLQSSSFSPECSPLDPEWGVQHFGIQGCLVRRTISSALRTSFGLQVYLASACFGPRASLDQPYDLFFCGCDMLLASYLEIMSKSSIIATYCSWYHEPIFVYPGHSVWFSYQEL